MKKTALLLLVALATVAGPCKVYAWGEKGHKIVVALAERHLNQKTKMNIKKYLPDGMLKEATWADSHRKDPEYAFTSRYHTMMMTPDFIYCPALRQADGGDCISGLHIIDYNLTHKSELKLTDSMMVFNIRMLIHIVGDMHCPAHAYLEQAPNNKWKCCYRGETLKSYHKLIDALPDYMYEGQRSRDVAGNLDKWPESRISEVQDGSFTDWAQDCCNRDRVLYDINPVGTYELDPKTVNKMQPAAKEALQAAGYRLAFLLNKYFDY